MQFFRLPVQEERNRGTPIALAGEGPVGTAVYHRLQSRAAPGGEEGRVRHGLARQFAQRLALAACLVHADEPLRRGTIDDGRLVPPAVHVAVDDFGGVEKRANLFQLGNDVQRRGPDVHAAEERQVSGELAITLHRIQDLLVRAAVVLPRDEVVHPVGRRRMHEARAGFERHVFAELETTFAIVEEVFIADVLQRLAPATAESCARQAVARERRVLEVSGENQQAAFSIDEVIGEIGMDVDRLVGGQRPRRRGPDDREDVFFR